MAEPLPIGVLGLGRMGQIHARHLAALPEARLVAVASRRPEIAHEIASQYNARPYVHYDDFFADRELRAVVIASATHEHAAHIKAAATAGMAIFCEKPIALRLEDTDEVLRAVTRAGVLLQVGFMRRFDPAFVEAKRRIESGDIGHPLTFKAVSRDPQLPTAEAEESLVRGNLFIDLGVHDFDMARWLMGQEICQVQAVGGALVYRRLAETGGVDNGLINMVFADGSLGSVELSRNAAYGYDVRTEVLGSEGALIIGNLQQTPLSVLTRAGVTHDVFPWFPERFAEAYLAEIKHFVRCVQAGEFPTPNGDDDRAALQIALAATESLKKGEPVNIAAV
ncbi:MAG: Gfo/Idh/MocA family oxidoreductase [Anaerolineae bacterium]|jgi:inositol 2-dehydrogenase|nr:Gfo/Idh/MocA family oxidoreductase [Anaerolineae bacterium]MDH7473448.1 Gfo/Idh/MocA family oxidoreductase [Anaerolineae bacterium]